MNSRSNPDDKSFDFASPAEIKSLDLMAMQLGNDYHSIVNNGNGVDLIHFEIRCTDIIRKLVDMVNRLVRFEYRLEIDDVDVFGMATNGALNVER